MREKLNENPIAQMVLIGVLLAVVGFFLVGKGGGSGEEASSETVQTVAAAGTAAEVGAPAALPAPGTGPGALPTPPKKVVDAFDAGDTVALLFIRKGGIDDRLATRSVRRLDGMPNVTTFVVPAKQVAHYVSITQGLDLNRLPAFVVIRPKRLDKRVATASIQYGFQSPQSVVQAIVDAGYHGGTLAYHP